MVDKNIRVLVIGIVGIPAKYGGFETLVENLVNCDCDNIKYIVFCSSREYPQKNPQYLGASL